MQKYLKIAILLNIFIIKMFHCKIDMNIRVSLAKYLKHRNCPTFYSVLAKRDHIKIPPKNF